MSCGLGAISLWALDVITAIRGHGGRDRCGGAGFYRPFWAPAYVSFFGFGGGLGFGFGFGWGGWGGFGWLADRGRVTLLPMVGRIWRSVRVCGLNRFGGLGRFGGFEPLHGGTQFSNLAHISDPHVGGALSTVGAGRFGSGRTAAVAATHAQLSSARMMTGNLPVVPSRASLSASGRAAASSTVHNTASQHFFGTQSGSRPESFQQQTAHLQQSMQQNHVSSVTAGGRSNSAMESRGASESRGNSAAAGGKSSAGTPATGREMNNSASRNAGDSGEWGIFRKPGGAVFGKPSGAEPRRVGRRLRRLRKAAVSRRVGVEVAPRLPAAARAAVTGTARRRVQATRGDRVPPTAPVVSSVGEVRVRN